jgi:DNA modification methylase
MLTILQGDVIEQLRTLPDESIHCCITSPPYWGLRDYSTNGQLGLEKTPDEYVAKMVAVFREVRRVLRRDGTLWLNLGDSFAANGISGLAIKGESSTLVGTANSAHTSQRKTVPMGLKQKDLCGIPWRVAFALQADGWWLRC